MEYPDGIPAAEDTELVEVAVRTWATSTPAAARKTTRSDTEKVLTRVSSLEMAELVVKDVSPLGPGSW